MSERNEMARVPQMTEKKSFWRPSCFLNLGGSFVLLLLTKVMKKREIAFIILDPESSSG
jgi:hypothetical protein